MSDALRIVFLGTRRPLSVRPLEALIRAGRPPCAAIVPRPAPERRARPQLEPLQRPAPAGGLPLTATELEPSVASVARAHDIAVFEVGRLGHRNSVETLRELRPDVVCVACFPEILAAPVLAVPRLGCFNVHPSCLPRFRGPSPLFWIFSEGLGHGGVSVHRMDAGVDTGPIVAQRRLRLPDGMRGAEAEELCGRTGAELLLEVLDALEAGRLAERPQLESPSRQGFPCDADFSVTTDLPARRAYNFIRGVAGPARPVRIVHEHGVLRVTDASACEPDGTLPRPLEVRAGALAVRFAPGVLHVPAGAHDLV